MEKRDVLTVKVWSFDLYLNMADICSAFFFFFFFGSSELAHEHFNGGFAAESELM